METDDLDKILGKSYSELTASEKEAIQDLCATEEEFIHLQQVFASVENYARETVENSSPMPETKAKLDDLFYDTYQSKGILWYNTLWASLYPAEKRFDQRPLVRIAAILILFICAVPFFNQSEKKSTQLASIEKEKAQEVEVESKVSAEPSSVTVEKDKSQPEKNTRMQENEVSPWLIASAPESATNEAEADYKADFGSDRQDQDEKASSAQTFTLGNAAPVSLHPDGIYMEKYMKDSDVSSSKLNVAMLDLLTPAF